MKDKKDKQCRFIFTAKGANISGGHCIYIYIYIYIHIELMYLFRGSVQKEVEE